MSQIEKVFLLLASAMLLCGSSVAQTPLADQRSLPQAPQPRQLSLVLDVDFKLNGGATSTKERSVTLNFTVREKSGIGNLALRDVTANVTQYRVLESENSANDLSSQPWIQMPSRPPAFELPLRNGRGQRYGERRVIFQIKTDALTSNVVSDTIMLEPVLKDYRVSPSGTNHPLIQYAADQGFTFPREYYETCKGGNCPAQGSENIASGSANVSLQGLISDSGGSSGVPFGLPGVVLATSAPAACVTKADYLLFEERSPNPFWRIKSITVQGASLHYHGPNRFRVKFSYENKSGVCSQTALAIGEVVVEGPETDDFVDSANPWKNGFVREQVLTRPLIQPSVRPQN